MKKITYTQHAKHCLDNGIDEIGTTNILDTTLCYPHKCCGWLDMHIDKNYAWKEKIWSIEIISHHPSAVFVHKSNGFYEYIELVDGEIISFNHELMHGLLPRKIADFIVSKNTLNCKEYLRFKRKMDQVLVKPKIVFDFIWFK